VLRSRIWTRHNSGDLAQLFDRLVMLEDLGVRLTPSAEAVRVCKNKLLTAARLHAAGIVVPETHAVEDVSEIGPCLDAWPEAVLKPVYGHSAIDIVRFRRQASSDPDIPGGLTSMQEITSWHLLHTYGVMLAQEFVPNPGCDLRVLCVNGQVVSATRRITASPTLEVKNMFHPYTEELADVTTDLAWIASQASKLLSLDATAVDIIEGPRGMAVIEVNPTISSWCQVDGDGLHQAPEGVGAAFAAMVLDLTRTAAAAGPGTAA
jgi:ribosomal protein S6--L-glutamate ligase